MKIWSLCSSSSAHWESILKKIIKKWARCNTCYHPALTVTFWLLNGDQNTVKTLQKIGDCFVIVLTVTEEEKFRGGLFDFWGGWGGLEDLVNKADVVFQSKRGAQYRGYRAWIFSCRRTFFTRSSNTYPLPPPSKKKVNCPPLKKINI